MTNNLPDPFRDQLAEIEDGARRVVDRFYVGTQRNALINAIAAEVEARVQAAANQRAAEVVRKAFVDAAGEAITRGRRGPIVTADWLLDFGQDRAAALAQPQGES